MALGNAALGLYLHMEIHMAFEGLFENYKKHFETYEAKVLRRDIDAAMCEVELALPRGRCHPLARS